MENKDNKKEKCVILFKNETHYNIPKKTFFNSFSRRGVND